MKTFQKLRKIITVNSLSQSTSSMAYGLWKLHPFDPRGHPATSVPGTHTSKVACAALRQRCTARSALSAAPWGELMPLGDLLRASHEPPVFGGLIIGKP